MEEERCRGTNAIRVTRLEIHWYSATKPTTDSFHPLLFFFLLCSIVSFRFGTIYRWHLPLRQTCFSSISSPVSREQTVQPSHQQPLVNSMATLRFLSVRPIRQERQTGNGTRWWYGGESPRETGSARDQLRWNVNGESSETKEVEPAARNA